MSQEILRSYDEEVIERIEALRRRFKVETIGKAVFGTFEYNLFCIVAGGIIKGKNVLVSAGFHGDEPAGVYASLEFLERHVIDYLEKFRFFLFPCVNPSGFEMNMMENMNGKNLNREFGEKSYEQEAQIIRAFLEARKLDFLFTMDMHEVDPDYECPEEKNRKEDNPKDCYIYELAADKSIRIGHKIIAELPPNTSVCKWDRIYLDKNSNGVV